MTPQEKVIWTENAKPREQIVMLRILDCFDKKFSATHEEIASKVGVTPFLFASLVPGLKELGWIESKRVYMKGKSRGVSHCDYKIKI
jgi:hypothetical protein